MEPQALRAVLGLLVLLVQSDHLDNQDLLETLVYRETLEILDLTEDQGL